MYGFIFCIFHARKLFVTCKAMLAHRVFDTFVGIESTVYFSDKREQNRCVAVPEGRISDPDCLTVSFLIVDAAKFCAVIADLHAQVFVFHGSHTLFPPVFFHFL